MHAHSLDHMARLLLPKLCTAKRLAPTSNLQIRHHFRLSCNDSRGASSSLWPRKYAVVRSVMRADLQDRGILDKDMEMAPF
jgi:hypothetical protein